MRTRTNFIGACVSDVFTMSKRAIKDSDRRKEVIAYKIEKERLAEEEKKKANIVSVYIMGGIKDITKQEWEELYQPLGFKIVGD